MNDFLTSWSPQTVMAAVVVAPLLIEAAISARNDRRLRQAGAIEPAGDVYRAMALAYPGSFVAMLLEGFLRAGPADASFRAGLVLFVAAKALKYWAIASLGSRWTFRVLVPPGSTRTVRGPYRWIAHPNYIAVAGELTGLALAMHAGISGPVSLLSFGYLMIRRIRVEESALRQGESA
jgi:methyltransferase